MDRFANRCSRRNLSPSQSDRIRNAKYLAETLQQQSRYIEALEAENEYLYRLLDECFQMFHKDISPIAKAVEKVNSGRATGDNLRHAVSLTDAKLK